MVQFGGLSNLNQNYSPFDSVFFLDTWQKKPLGSQNGCSKNVAAFQLGEFLQNFF